MKWTNLLNSLKFVLASFLGYKLKIFQIHILCYNTKIVMTVTNQIILSIIIYLKVTCFRT